MDGYLPWSEAMDRALYGPGGFYLGPGGPAAHFRTSVHASDLFATAVVRLLREVDEALGAPADLAFVDLAAGRGELVSAVVAQLDGDPLGRRLRPVAVDLAARPAELPAPVGWLGEAPGGVTGLLLANEFLDNVPCDLVELTEDGPRQVFVGPDGTERLGPAPESDQQAWLDAWWPLAEVGERAEVGLRRDAAWRAAVGSVTRGVAVAIDYSHTRAARPPYGTLTGYAHGRQVQPVPDGTCDITAHVALDSCAQAARTAQPPASWTMLLTQRQALRRLGVAAERPEHAMASRDPRGYLRALARVGQAAELTAAEGLGGFGWLVQGAGVASSGILRD
ncbi:MAG TPA: SAM-dependent methyltransferase [Actinocrinis sp.]|nr:SAM-dependent methyltransferase [Actinocrinis sp.]